MTIRTDGSRIPMQLSRIKRTIVGGKFKKKFLNLLYFIQYLPSLSSGGIVCMIYPTINLDFDLSGINAFNLRLLYFLFYSFSTILSLQFFRIFQNKITYLIYLRFHSKTTSPFFTVLNNLMN